MESLILLFLFIFSLSTVWASEPYRVTSFPHRSGLYYEGFQQIQLVRETWRIFSIIDVDALINAHQQDINAYRNYSETCRELFTPYGCARMLQESSILFELTEKERLSAYLRQIIDRTPLNKPSSYSRFGFSGSALRKIFGTLDYHDYGYLTKEIDRLYQNQVEIVNIANNSTHIIRAKINTLVDELSKTNAKVNDLASFASTPSQQQENWKVMYEKEGDYILLGIDFFRLIQQHNSLMRQTITAVEEAKRGIINPITISVDQLLQAVQDMEESRPHLNPLQPLDHIDLQVLSKISQVSAARIGNFFVTIVKVPLLDKELWKSYHLRPYKIQHIWGSKPLALTILPAKEFLVISSNNETYFLASSSDIDSCIPVGNSLACNPTAVLNSVENMPICESELLWDPSNETLRSCNVRVTQPQATQWIALAHQNLWLFSIFQSEIYNIICGDKHVAYLHLNGTGILELSPGCIAHNKFETIFSLGELKTNITGIVPKNSLSFSSLSPSTLNQIRHLVLSGDDKNYHIPTRDTRIPWGTI